MGPKTEHGTLDLSEPHPSSRDAYRWFRSLSVADVAMWVEAFSSCAISGNRLAEVCAETLRRLRVGEAVSDRYLLGLVWAMRHPNPYEGEVVNPRNETHCG